MYCIWKYVGLGVIFVVICPNCGKKLRDNFIYCRICGSKLNGDKIGDFSTEVVNVFNYGNEFLYLYSANGRQIILKSSSLEELESEVVKNSHPWSFKDSSKNVEVKKSETVPAPEFTTEFLKASSLKKPEIISTSSTFKKPEIKKEEGYNPDFEVSHVVEKPKPKIIPVTEKPEKGFPA